MRTLTLFAQDQDEFPLVRVPSVILNRENFKSTLNGYVEYLFNVSSLSRKECFSEITYLNDWIESKRSKGLEIFWETH